ncbi:Crp/Fnr family transcriptional regulator [Spirosoma sp. BT702]|uniref:Crp/Fnr family transcriptional regulator n=1 Tax=Spirosoma profusum TaxID=2771354 RepID=A0A926XY15_9BACT|nr:Crp/Fnr family transcriptional regulator [Spirosoma profusum]MBD2702879.1 Crp/Fnr family transcriptional regulator [Spirosoma profusum]
MTIIEYINATVKTELKDNSELPFKVTRKSFKKGDIISPYGQIERNAYFLISGLIEITVLKEAEERIVDFFLPGCFFNSYTSFITQQPSDTQVCVLLDCEVEVIEYNELQRAYKTSLIANQLGRLATEAIFVISTNREKDFLTKSAQERYNDLLSTRPQLINLVPVHKIAKYLGIHPESLSRLRKSIF